MAMAPGRLVVVSSTLVEFVAPSHTKVMLDPDSVTLSGTSTAGGSGGSSYVNPPKLVADNPLVFEVSLANFHPTDVQYFSEQYRAHCQQILDAIYKTKFDDVSSIIQEFWEELMPNYRAIAEDPSMTNYLITSDDILYESIINLF